MGNVTGETTWIETRYLQVPLTPDELRERGELLADLVRGAALLEEQHARERKAMKDAATTLNGRIQHLAAIVNARAEERSVKVEVRYNPVLALIEEVRTDTGEVVQTRAPTPEDKARAQAAMQPPLL